MADARGGDPIGTAMEAGLLVSDAVLGRLARIVDASGAPGATAPSAPPAHGPRLPRPSVPKDRIETAVAGPVDAVSTLAGATAARIVPAVLDRVDLNALLDRVDVDRLIGRIDVDAILDRIDVPGVVARVDVDEIVDRVDVDHLLDRVDVQAVVARVDVGGLTAEALDAVDIGQVISESTASLGTEVVEDFRLQAMLADRLVARVVDSLLLRRGRPRDDAVGPEAAR